MSERAGKHAVTEGDLDHIVVRDSCRTVQSCYKVRPGFYIVFRITDNRGFSGSARRRVNTHYLAQRDGKHAVRVVEAEIVFGCKREPGKVGERLDVIRIDVLFVEFVPVTGYIFVNTMQRRL